MAVPIVIGAIAAATAAYGSVKGVQGARDHKSASSISNAVDRLVSDNVRITDDYRVKTSETLELYGKSKLDAFHTQIPEFLDLFGRLKNVELVSRPELESLKLDEFSKVTLGSLKNDYDLLKNSGLGVGAGVTGGAALAFGAYNGTMMLASASTGTAISTLGGAAATNATLAWLGGGSLAAGGGGIALGTIVLGGIVAGPALAIFGHIVGNKGEEALNKAKANMEQARTFSDEMILIRDKLAVIQSVASLANKVFMTILSRFDDSIKDLEEVINSYGIDYKKFPREAKEKVFASAKFAQLVSTMINTSILNDNGDILPDSRKEIRKTRRLIDR